PMSTIRALPDSFIDLPAAVDSARRFGMFGALKDARLATITNRGAPRVAWRLRSASAAARVYFVDATTGTNIPPAQAPPTPAPTLTQTQMQTQKPKLKAKLVDKVKGLFHH
ncbi:MAG: hypothetical protein ABJA80_03185, partial [bacterium]